MAAGVHDHGDDRGGEFCADDDEAGGGEIDLGPASGRAREYLSARRPCSVAVAAIARLIAVEHLCVLDNGHGEEQ